MAPFLPSRGLKEATSAHAFAWALGAFLRVVGASRFREAARAILYEVQPHAANVRGTSSRNWSRRTYYAKENRRNRRQFAHASRIPRGAGHDERARWHAHECRVRLSVHVPEILRNGTSRCRGMRVRCWTSGIPYGGARTVQSSASADGCRAQGAISRYRAFARIDERARYSREGLGRRRRAGHGVGPRRRAGIRNPARERR